MTFEPYFPKKRGRPPKKETIRDRSFKADMRRLLLAERQEPLDKFDLAAIAERLTRKR